MKHEMPSSPCSDSPAKSNHFFKIILYDSHSQTKLMIPRKFVRKYGKNLDSRIFLKAPNGLAWPVNLERHEGDVWLQDGWMEFARFYSIKFGYLLVFKYRGHCDFKVRVFDPSSTEIEYPSSRSAKLNIGESSQVRKRPIEIYDSSSSDLIRPRRKRVRKPILKDASHDGVSITGYCGSVIKEAEARALASTEAFRSDNPFFFRVMRKSYVDGKGRVLVLRKEFEEGYKKWKDNDQVHLQVAEKSWQVNCDMKGNGCRLRFGWDRFARDNSLSAGDVCVFELIDACKKVLQVVIIRATKETNGDGGSAIEESRSKVPAFASAKDFKSHNPFFVLDMKQSDIDGKGRGIINNTHMIKKEILISNHSYFMCFIYELSCIDLFVQVLRKGFEKTYQMWKNNEQVILQFEGKTWPVFSDKNSGCCRLRSGWDIFVKDNLLTVGDACVFELIDASKKLLQVFIFRAAREADCKENKILPRVKSEARGLTSVSAFTSKYPFFRVKVYPSSLYGSNLSLPQKFIKRYIAMDSCIVTLQISDGITWLVKCKVYNSCSKFSVGWNKFAKANQLDVGDVCTFELINFSTKLFQVFIFRAAKEAECGKENEKLPRVKSEAKEARMCTSVDSFTSTYSFFKVRVYPSSLTRTLSLPSKFIKRHVTKDICNVTLQTSNGKSWLVKCIVYKYGAKFSGGWNRFAGANRLAAGDVCAFELINLSDKLLNVVIFRNKSSNFKGNL